MEWFCSDLHFCHNKDFIYKTRGFDSIDEHDRTIVHNWNSVVNSDDDVYLLGDLMLNDNDRGSELLNKLNGQFKLIILGNHDTISRKELYKDIMRNHNDDSSCHIYEAKTINLGKWRFYLSHYPTITANFNDDKKHLPLVNLFGHTHSFDKFYNNNPYMYNVSLEAHNMFPVNLEQIKEDIRNKVKENTI